MTYKYDSVLKSFQYSKENYKIISDFLLSGDKENPNILLNVTKISTVFGKESKYWFRMESVKEFIISLIEIKCENNDRKLKKIILYFLETEKIPKVSKTHLCKNDEFVGFLRESKYQVLVKLAKQMGLIVVKRGNAKLTNTTSGTWIHKDLAIKYAEWLDPKFSIWISQKIQELVSDGVAWNKIRQTTRIDYKPLTDAIEKNIITRYPNMDENIVYGQIANYINIKVIGQKAREIREEKGIEANQLTRDFFTKEELDKIEKLQVFTEILISQFQIYTFKKLEKKIELYNF
jgi:hypothetical protein